MDSQLTLDGHDFYEVFEEDGEMFFFGYLNLTVGESDIVVIFFFVAAEEVAIINIKSCGCNPRDAKKRVSVTIACCCADICIESLLSTKVRIVLHILFI